MHWVRIFLSSLLHSALLVLLLTGAVLFGIGNTLESNHVERILSSDTVYQKLLDEGTQQARDLGDATTQIALPSSTGTELRGALSTAFPKSFLDASLHSVINANYDWLRGDTAAPRFSVHIASGKQHFATDVSQVILARLRAVPECSTAQLQALQTSDPSSLTCRPPGINTEVEAAQVEQQIIHAQSFLGEAAITQDTLTSGHGQDHVPYYRQLAWLPRAFQALRYAPYVCALLAVVLALLAVYAHPNRRRGIWKLARTLLIAGLVLVSSKVAGVIAYNQLRSYLQRSGTTRPLQQLALDVTHNTLGAFSHITILIGAVYASLAAAIILGLLIARFATNKQRVNDENDTTFKLPTAEAMIPPAPPIKKKRPIMDIVGKPSPVTVLSKDQPAPSNSPNVTPVEPKKKASALGKRGIIQ